VNFPGSLFQQRVETLILFFSINFQRERSREEKITSSQGRPRTTFTKFTPSHPNARKTCLWQCPRRLSAGAERELDGCGRRHCVIRPDNSQQILWLAMTSSRAQECCGFAEVGSRVQLRDRCVIFGAGDPHLDALATTRDATESSGRPGRGMGRLRIRPARSIRPGCDGSVSVVTREGGA
jgi:hypothetical protein